MTESVSLMYTICLGTQGIRMFNILRLPALPVR